MPSDSKMLTVSIRQGEKVELTRDEEFFAELTVHGVTRDSVDMDIEADDLVEIMRPDGGVAHDFQSVKLDRSGVLTIQEGFDKALISYARRSLRINAPSTITINRNSE